jgi:hypothetical protein
MTRPLHVLALAVPRPAAMPMAQLSPGGARSARDQSGNGSLGATARPRSSIRAAARGG